MITNPEITVDAKNKLPHGTVRRAPTGFAHAILLDQMGNEAKWHIIDLYEPMEIETDRDVADWPIVYVPAPDEVWTAMNSQPSYRDHVAEDFGNTPEKETQAPVETNGPMYPVSAFVIPCKNCDHKKWVHDKETGECHGRAGGPDQQCDCSGFEDVPEEHEKISKPHFSSFVPVCLCGHDKEDHYTNTPVARGMGCSHPACPCVGFKEDT